MPTKKKAARKAAEKDLKTDRKRIEEEAAKARYPKAGPKFTFRSYLLSYGFAAFTTAAAFFMMLIYIASAVVYMFVILFGQYPPEWIMWLLFSLGVIQMLAMVSIYSKIRVETGIIKPKDVAKKAFGFIINFCFIVFLVFFSHGTNFEYVRIVAMAALLLNIVDYAATKRCGHKKAQ
jgi:hypothetical protein